MVYETLKRKYEYVLEVTYVYVYRVHAYILSN